LETRIQIEKIDYIGHPLWNIKIVDNLPHECRLSEAKACHQGLHNQCKVARESLGSCCQQCWEKACHCNV